jgi:hypothetical protein
MRPVLRITSTASTEDDLRAVLEAWLRQDPSVRARVLLDVAETIRHERQSDTDADDDAIVDRTVAPDSAVVHANRHTSYSRMRRVGPHVLMAGARARGSAHAANRRHAASWFDIAHVDGWTFIVIAEGAAASPLAGLCARAACDAAIATLQQTPPPRPVDGHPDAQAVRRAIHDAIVEASHAVLDAARTCALDDDSARALGRPPVPADLACSCLVAAHRAIDGAGSRALIVSSHAGRGLTGCIDTSGRTVVLGHGALGALDDITLPLEDHRLVAALEQRTIECSADVSTLIVAGARLAASYASDEPHLKRLEADLVLNGILPVPHVGSASIDTALSTVNLASLSVLPARLAAPWSVPQNGGEGTDAVRSAIACARSFGIDWPELAREPLLLAAGRVSTDASVPIDVRLRRWLELARLDDDGGDRTIVVWHREPAIA